MSRRKKKLRMKKDNSNDTTEKKITAGSIAYGLVILILLGIFLYAGYMLYGIISEYRKGEEEYKGLMQYVQTAEDLPSGEDLPSEEEAEDSSPGTEIRIKAPVTVDFTELKKVNQDIIGWIYCEAIPEISYPIVQGEDNDYYLHHTVEKNKNTSASIFMDCRNTPDFRDTMTIVYGHKMKNKSMFGRLGTYLKQEVYDKSPYIWILTPEKDIRYEIFSAREVKYTDILYGLNLDQGEEQKYYMKNMQEKSEIKTTISLTDAEPILTLSTCTGNSRTRCVVQAARQN